MTGHSNNNTDYEDMAKNAKSGYWYMTGVFSGHKSRYGAYAHIMY